jgi:hypothetical protein
MESCGTPACSSRGVGISPSSENANFPFEKKKLTSLTVLSAELKFDYLRVHSKQGAISATNSLHVSNNTAAMQCYC